MSTPNELMRHALGVQEDGLGRWKKPWRNYFVAGESDADAWCSLAAQGMATLTSNGNELTDNCPVFTVTNKGREHALAGIIFQRKYGYGRPTNP
jgi:hypothetical protein